MAFSMLPSLRPGDWRAVVLVRVCRKWEYRGGTDDGPIQHVDLVLIDQQGNPLYAEIPGTEVEAKSPQVEEGSVYVIARFRVSNAKSAYRAVDAPFMIEFTFHTTITAPASDVPPIPKYAYRITAIDGLPARVGDTKNFVDTMGTLVEMSDLETVHLPNKGSSTLSRHVILRDLSYAEIKVTLWGERATAFTTEGVYNRAEAKPILVLFVGGLMKSYQGSYYLSGNAACRWYFNPEIPEARPFYESYQNQRLEVRSVASPIQQRVQPRVPADLEQKSLQEMNAIDPYEFAENGYRCTVTINRLVPNTTWWFPSCTKCGKSCVPEGSGYRCVPCSNSSFKFKFKVCFIAVDGTGEGEMVAFGDVARRIIGKPVQQLLRTSAGPTVYPPEITRLISLSFTFTITMTRQSFYKPQKTYNVAALVTAHGAPVLLPPNPIPADGSDESRAESGDSSGGDDDLSASGTPDTTHLSPGSLATPPPGLQTPSSKKHQRSDSSKAKGHPSCRRKILQDSPNANSTAASASLPSAKAGKEHVAETDNPSHVSAQESV